jgi:hypothetical protein
MATLTMSGSGYAVFENGAAEWTLLPSGELRARIAVVEHRVPETPRPFFQIDTNGVTYQGQAVEPPTFDEHGRVCFNLTLAPLRPSDG